MKIKRKSRKIEENRKKINGKCIENLWKSIENQEKINEDQWNSIENHWKSIEYRRKPKKIIEIGSGHSSLLANQAIKNNEKIDNVITKLTCIEPYENKWLEKNEIEVIRQKVEEVDIKIFNDLNKNDILFIDSSHVIKPQGDIIKIFLEILPKLKTGVIIHIHDIFSPRDYPENWLKVENRFFNETSTLNDFETAISFSS